MKATFNGIIFNNNGIWERKAEAAPAICMNEGWENVKKY
jgi:hypothetical protein